MENLVELTRVEAIDVDGGNAYEVGYKVGKFFGNLTDWYEGFFDGFRDGFDG